MTHPKVSVIVPSYNHAYYIGSLIESIYRQTFRNFEVIIVDDGSTDDSSEILKNLSDRFGFQLVLKKNEGLCTTLNRGIELAKGEYIVNIGSDDILPPERLKEQVEYLEANPDVDVVGGSMYIIDEKGNVCGKRVPAMVGNITFKDMTVINRLYAPTAMIRSSVFRRFGPYPAEYLLEDYFLWLKILKNGGKIHNLKRFWVYYRINNENLEKKFTWYYEGALQALSPYAGERWVSLQMYKNNLFYCIKLCLLLGREFKTKYLANYLRLSRVERVVVSLISILPKAIRNSALVSLKLKV